QPRLDFLRIELKLQALLIAIEKPLAVRGRELGKDPLQDRRIEEIVNDDVRERLRSLITWGQRPSQCAALFGIESEIVVDSGHVQHGGYCTKAKCQAKSAAPREEKRAAARSNTGQSQIHGSAVRLC